MYMSDRLLTQANSNPHSPSRTKTVQICAFSTGFDIIKLQRPTGYSRIPITTAADPWTKPGLSKGGLEDDAGDAMFRCVGTRSEFWQSHSIHHYGISCLPVHRIAITTWQVKASIKQKVVNSAKLPNDVSEYRNWTNRRHYASSALVVRLNT
jgi:hypothetical protein